MSPATVLRYEDLPALYATADGTAILAQRRFLRSIKGQIFALLIGAISSSVAAAVDIDSIALVSAAAFTAAAALRVHQGMTSLEDSWSDARLIAESVKSLAWRYAIGVHPFPVDDETADEVDEVFQARLWETLSEVDSDAIPGHPDAGANISAAMRQLRSMPLAERVAAYEEGRIEDQIDWYSARSHRNAVRSRRWDAAFFAASAVAVVFGLLQVAGWVTVNVLNVAGYSAGLIGTWTGVSRHQRQARAYGMTAHELMAMRAYLQNVDDEETWVDFVNQAEEAISTEHTSWRVARRG